MDTSFETSKINYSNEWYTPKYFFDAFPEFDLDPCAPLKPLWKTAKHTFNIHDDGLKQDWSSYGSVWLNPPYERPLINRFLEKMVEHNNGIALVYTRMDTVMTQDLILKPASSILFIKGRVKFYKMNGEEGLSAGCGSMLVSYGDECKELLLNCGIEGVVYDFKKLI
ncbi:MAG: adenine methyltransferase [Bacteroidales bacterium]|nr:adenine methyltransferase [Bacteroidales bacterium]